MQEIILRICLLDKLAIGLNPKTWNNAEQSDFWQSEQTIHIGYRKKEHMNSAY